MSTELQKKESITLQVLSRVKSLQQCGAIMLPPDYSTENALKAADLVLQDMTTKDGKPVLEICTKPSIANALLTMITEGLTVMKKQGAFVVYGNKLTWQREYFGTVAMAKRYSGVKDVRAIVVYEGDVLKYSIDPLTGIKRLVQHDQDPEDIDMNKIKGAYAILIEEDGTPVFEYMTMNQIRKSWMQGAARGNSPAHQNFPDEMAKKTVINRICKPYINESDDAILFKNEDNKEPGNETFDTTVEDLTDAPTIPQNVPKPEIKPEPKPESIEQPETKEKQKDLPF